MSIALAGEALLLTAFLACAVGMLSGLLGARERAPRIASAVAIVRPDLARRHAGRAASTALVATASASLLLIGALVWRDFDLAYVAGRTNATLPIQYRFSAFWSGQEGSLLLWLLVLCAYGALMRRSLTRAGAAPRMVSAATGVLFGAATFFALLVAFVARPFALVHHHVADGAGMSPALQNYWMALHPPALYAGYIGVTVPFAIVVGALLAGSPAETWAPLARRWALVAWIGLTLGLLLGARWAYEEIGWGGYWGWDPVENAALMPWLTVTAFVHSITVQQRRGMMRWWNVLLVTLSFCLSVFGTFLTRSGVLSSVHSFVSTSVGWYFLIFLAIVVAASLAVLARSREQLAADGDVDSLVSREAAFLLNNLLLVAIALTILWGVGYPILSQAFGFGRVSLQAPWFDFFLLAFGLPLLLVMAVGVAVPWRRGNLRQVARSLVPGLAFAIAAGALLLATGHGSSAAGVAAVSFGVLVVGGIAEETRQGLVARRRAEPGIGLARAARTMVARNRRRYGGYLAHAGVGLLVIAIAASNAWKLTATKTMHPGDHLRVGAWTLRYQGPERERTPNVMMVRARFALTRPGSGTSVLRSGRNFYPASGEIANSVAIHHDLLRGGDVYVVVNELAPDGTAQVKAIVNPMMQLLWLAGLLTALGGAVAAWPARPRSSGGDDAGGITLRAEVASLPRSAVPPLSDAAASERV
jgi:cytochrome c-type biogenesis protein CcmF